MTMYMTSPFRYPGGKGRLLDRILPVLEKVDDGSGTFIDACVGGGSVLLGVLQDSNFNVTKVIINDLDPSVYAFWKVLASKRGAKTLADRVRSTEPTIDLFYSIPEIGSIKKDQELAFAAFFLNRTSFSGIVASETGPIGGKEQKSEWDVSCRWNGERHATEILQIAELLSNFDVKVSKKPVWKLQGEGLMYVDPPYIQQGNKLYATGMDGFGHMDLAIYLDGRGHWVLTYDENPRVRFLYRGMAGVELLPARYSITGAGRKTHVARDELIIDRGPLETPDEE